MFEFVKRLTHLRPQTTTPAAAGPAAAYALTLEQFSQLPTLQFEAPLHFQGLGASVQNSPGHSYADTLRRFDELVGRRRFHDAYRIAAEHYAQNSSSPDALALLGDACWELRQTSLAQEYLDRAKATGADSVRFHKVMAKSLRGRNATAAAVEHAARAYELDPHDPDVIVGLVLAEFLNGSQAAALKVLNTVPKDLAGHDALVRARSLVKSFFKPAELDETTLGFQKGPPFTLESRPITVTHPFALQDIELTNHCPMKCVMCPRTSHMTRALGHMAFETFKRTLDQWAEVDPSLGSGSVVWLHHYGESLVHPEFDKFIKYGREMGASVGLSINPLILTPPIAERLLAARPHTLWMALDGHDDKSFETVRGIPKPAEPEPIGRV